MNSRTIRNATLAAVPIMLFTLAFQSVKLVRIVSENVPRTTELPGEFYPFLSVQLHAKVAGYVDRVLVDRGSSVKKGDLLVELSAPEMTARISQAEAELTAAESSEAEAQAQLVAAQSTYSKLQEAAKTPGAVAENDIVQAKQQADAAQSLVHSKHRTVEALRSNLTSQQDLAAYLRVTAPFDGIISTRYIHPGALVGPGSDAPLLQLDQISRLRLAVAVPESDLAGIVKGARVGFTVPAFPARTFYGRLARPAYAVDTKTRTMPVELDVLNPQQLLAPGMYAAVRWPVNHSPLLVPSTSVVTTTERVFVIRNRDGRAEWVDVRRGATAGSLVEVDGALKAGDEIVERATDETRDGSPLQ